MREVLVRNGTVSCIKVHETISVLLSFQEYYVNGMLQ